MSVGLLFSDIEGSTRLLQELGPRFAALISDHHRLMREAFVAHGGQEQGNEGDSFFVTFDDPMRAVAAALDAQRAVRRHQWPDGIDLRIRMGMHAGDVTEVGDTLIGMSIHEAARVMSAAHGGQILATDVIAREVSVMPDGSGWSELGEFTLKDVSTLRLHQLEHPDLPSRFPPPRTKRYRRVQLPVPTTTFLGRQEELTEITALLSEQRLVTLTGAGGAGKSRLAVTAAAGLESSFVDGIWLVELSTVTDAPEVISSIVAAAETEGSTLAPVVAVIGDGRALLVIDNCEHVIDAAAEAIETLLQSCPSLSVLATSREPLGLAGEVAWRVPSLADAAAVDLFIARAQAADPRMTFDDDARALASTICVRLDGIPLAIELAAARLSSLRIEQVAERLDQRFRLLTGGRRGGLARQRTLQATVDWSFDLLEQDARRLLCWLGPFIGGLTDDAAIRMGAQAGLDALDVPDVLDSLVNKSLVQREDRKGYPRYRLLETIRQYALDRLLGDGELVAARDAHLEITRVWTRDLAPHVWEVADRGDSHVLLSLDLDNLRAALDWAMERDEVEVAAEIAGSTASFWIGGGYGEEAVRRLTAIAEHGRGTPIDLLRMLFGAHICATNAHVAATPWVDDRLLEIAYDIPLDVDYGWLAPMAIGYVAPYRLESADDRVRLVTEQVERARSTGSPVAIAATLQALSHQMFDAGRLDEARTVITEAIESSDRGGSAIGSVRCRATLMEIELAADDRQRAWEIGVEAMERARRTDDQAILVSIILFMVDLSMAKMDPALTVDLAAEALELARGRVGGFRTAPIENLLACAQMTLGDLEAARRNVDLAVQHAEPSDDGWLAAFIHTSGDVARVSGDLQRAVTDYLRAGALALSQDDERLAAHCVLGLAGVFVNSDPSLAARLAASGRVAVGAISAGDRVQHDRLEAQLAGLPTVEPLPVAEAVELARTALNASRVAP